MTKNKGEDNGREREERWRERGERWKGRDRERGEMEGWRGERCKYSTSRGWEEAGTPTEHIKEDQVR